MYLNNAYFGNGFGDWRYQEVFLVYPLVSWLWSVSRPLLHAWVYPEIYNPFIQSRTQPPSQYGPTNMVAGYIDQATADQIRRSRHSWTTGGCLWISQKIIATRPISMRRVNEAVNEYGLTKVITRM